MNKSLVLHVLVIIVAIVLASLVASKLHYEQEEISPDLSLVTNTPLAGLHKFASDVEWMRFIQYAGSQKSVDDNNVKTHSEKLKKIISLDPNFEKSYSVGVPMLAVESPSEAIEILKFACDKVKHLDKNWKIPFYAGFILTHHIPDPDVDQLNEAVQYFDLAVKRAGTPEKYVVNALLRTKAKLENKKNPNKYANLDHAKLAVFFREWEKAAKSADSFADSGGGGVDRSMLTAKTLELAQKMKSKYADNKSIQDLIAKVKKGVLSGQHLCEGCLSVYSPGDKFCASCGKDVVVFGVCTKCGTVTKGGFCHKCGNKSE